MPHHEPFVQNILDNADTAALQRPDLHAQLATYVNQLILNNFDELIHLLYRVDVSEQKLKILLKENNNADAGGMIATLIIERQIQKILSRREHGRRDNDIVDGEESW